MIYDFEKITDRHGTDCLKYDFTAERHVPDDVHSYWIADMDFPTAPSITEAIIRRVQQGIFGYTDVKDHYYEAVASWYALRFGYTPERHSLIVTPGVVFALCAAIYAYTQPGEGVLLQNPVYYPFSESIVALGRKLVNNPLVNHDGYYEIDFDDFEQKIKNNNVKLFLLCSPHNPVGRVWKRIELEHIAAICLKYNVKIFADEIHCDFVYKPNVHIPFPSISKEVENITIWGTAPTKTFNLAGLQVSNIFIKNREMYQTFRHALDAFGYSQKNTLGLTASEAAYRTGGEWVDQLKSYIEHNAEQTVAYFVEHETRIKTYKPEGTYLIWLDCRMLGLTTQKLEELVIKKAKLWLDSGSVFGPEGNGFQRINIACSWSYLEEGLRQFCTAASIPYVTEL
jgi:cysteine-S-conjugate beta-lyase